MLILGCAASDPTRALLGHMTQESQTIEVEVVASESSIPSTQPEIPEDPTYRRPQWKNWPGQVRQLNSRWWPLWILLGIIGIGLLLTIGVVFALIFLIFRFFRNFLRAIFR